MTEDFAVEVLTVHLDGCREHLAAVTNGETDNPAYHDDPARCPGFDDTSRAIAREVVDMLDHLRHWRDMDVR